MVEAIGFCLFLIGIGGMDSNGNMFWVAAATATFGLFLMYVGGRIQDNLVRNYKCKHYKER